MIGSPGSVEAQRAFILGDPKPEADVGNLARPITDVVSSPHSKRGMTVRGMGLVAVDRGERPLRVEFGGPIIGAGMAILGAKRNLKAQRAIGSMRRPVASRTR